MWHGSRPRVYESALKHGQGCVCCEMLHSQTVYPSDSGFMGGEKSHAPPLTLPITPSW